MKHATPTEGTLSARRERRFSAREPFFERLNENGCLIPTNPHHISSREQSLKDTWFGFYKIYCCRNGRTHDGKRLRDQSSGNFPKYFPGKTIPALRQAMRASLEESGAYMAGVEEAREKVAAYYDVPPHHLFFTAGISDGIEMVHKLFLHNTKGRILIPNETYPTHFSTAITFGGPDLIVTIDRDPETGIPDFSRHVNGHNPFSLVGFSSFIPYDNPNPIVYPEWFFRNGQGSGVFDLNEAAFIKDGIIRPIVLDMIYQSFSWPAQHVAIRKLIELGDEKNILIFLNSASKVFLEPNKKAGVLAVHIPDCLLKYAEGNIVRDLESDFQRRLGVIPNTSIAALVAAHEILARDEGEPQPELEEVRSEGRKRFIGGNCKGGNQAVMCSIPFVKPVHPDVRIESSGYNLFYIEHPYLPWMKPEYKKEVLGRLRTVLEQNGWNAALSAFDAYMMNVAPENAAPSDIFCLDLVMSTGVAFAPAERFYKLGTAPKRVAFRPVMVADPDNFMEDAKLVEEFLLSRLD
jgi:aspartate/methionine/tyrosine aminotransferase